MTQTLDFRTRRVIHGAPPSILRGRPPKLALSDPATLEKFERERMGIAAKE